MLLATLKNQLNTGIDSLDHEHRKLVGLMEDLCEQFERAGPGGPAGRSRGVGNCFGVLYSRLLAHSTLEKSLMRHGNYPHYAAHRADHERLLRSIREMMGACEQGRCADCGKSLRACLGEWFSDHVESTDTGPCALEQ